MTLSMTKTAILATAPITSKVTLQRRHSWQQKHWNEHANNSNNKEITTTNRIHTRQHHRTRNVVNTRSGLNYSNETYQKMRRKNSKVYCLSSIAICWATNLAEDGQPGRTELEVINPDLLTAFKASNKDQGTNWSTNCFGASLHHAALPGLNAQSKRLLYVRAWRQKEASTSHTKPNWLHSETFHEVNGDWKKLGRGSRTLVKISSISPQFCDSASTKVLLSSHTDSAAIKAAQKWKADRSWSREAPRASPLWTGTTLTLQNATNLRLKRPYLFLRRPDGIL